jgi:hypothetical protein
MLFQLIERMHEFGPGCINLFAPLLIHGLRIPMINSNPFRDQFVREICRTYEAYQIPNAIVNH